MRTASSVLWLQLALLLQTAKFSSSLLIHDIPSFQQLDLNQDGFLTQPEFNAIYDLSVDISGHPDENIGAIPSSINSSVSEAAHRSVQGSGFSKRKLTNLRYINEQLSLSTTDVWRSGPKSSVDENYGRVLLETQSNELDSNLQVYINDSTKAADRLNAAIEDPSTARVVLMVNIELSGKLSVLNRSLTIEGDCEGNSSGRCVIDGAKMYNIFTIDGCSDTDWRDSLGSSCRNYMENQWCRMDGGYGSSWDEYWGTFDDYAPWGGQGASSACCSCGGRRAQSSALQVTLHNLELRGGRAFYDSSSGSGGAVYANGYVDLQVTQCLLENNAADYGGGGIALCGTHGGEVRMSNSTVRECEAPYGGGIYIWSVDYTHARAHLFLHGVRMVRNWAVYGGAVYGDMGARITLSDRCELVGNYAKWGGAGVCANTHASVFVDGDSRLRQNVVDAALTIAAGAGAGVSLDDFVLRGGGGVLVAEHASVVISGSQITDNYVSVRTLEENVPTPPRAPSRHLLFPGTQPPSSAGCVRLRRQLVSSLCQLLALSVHPATAACRLPSNPSLALVNYPLSFASRPRSPAALVRRPPSFAGRPRSPAALVRRPPSFAGRPRSPAAHRAGRPFAGRLFVGHPCPPLPPLARGPPCSAGRLPAASLVRRPPSLGRSPAVAIGSGRPLLAGRPLRRPPSSPAALVRRPPVRRPPLLRRRLFRG
ncbi:hypothetical protein CYMTET_49999 [Cymbomonas tetramitiformis]|uniref:Pectate lyase C n=1 Tax=Cymbomonas tetramitiformis TaxID=36881 RepID=A0AAE0ETB4_9CHLO|nr:hypothetical protein CYMTET_49999 [Cymbomonas tetramitiformis]